MLANRTHFRADLDRAVAQGGTLAVLIMDIDRFKEVNDALGHHVGDHLLETIAKRLATIVGTRGTVARLGGDEFAVLLPEIDDAEQAMGIARTIHTHVGAPTTVSSIVLEVDASIGIAMMPDHADDSTTLMRRADVAMYEAKTQGGGVSLYDRSYDWNTPERLRLASDLRRAIDNGELRAYYQPVTCITTGRVLAAEALARWHHPHLGVLAPDQFIPLAERTALLDQLTMSILDQALRDVHAWIGAGHELSVSVNLPVQALLDVEFANRVKAKLAAHGVDPARLTFEITENGFMSNPDRMLGVLDALAGMGIGLAIDDFGTGYSSLSYLQRLPARQLKIDKSFVFPVTTTPKAASIVRSIIELGRNLGMTVVAEGVEDRTTLSALRLMGCDRAQGFHISRPLPADAFLLWLQSAEAETLRRGSVLAS